MPLCTPLQPAVGGSSAGQVYHHLSTLTAAGVVENAGGVHRIPPTGVVPVLVTVLAAADLGGVLR